MTRLGRRELLGAAAASLLLQACHSRARGPRDIMIGASPTGVPFSFVDPMSNELTGSMVDSALLVATAIGAAPLLRITPFAALIPSLTSGKIDMIAAALLRTPERERIVAFSDPIYAYAGGLVIRGSDPHHYRSLDAIRHLRVGAQVGTRFVDQLHAAGVEQLSTYDGLGDLLRDLDNGRIDAVYGDEPILDYQVRVGPKRDARLVGEFVAPAREELCFVMRKDDRRLPQINAAIERLKTTRIAAITRKWGLK